MAGDTSPIRCSTRKNNNSRTNIGNHAERRTLLSPRPEERIHPMLVARSPVFVPVRREQAVLLMFSTAPI
jgi:hypothetical protein